MSFTPEFKIGNNTSYHGSGIFFQTEVEALAYAGALDRRYRGAVSDYRAVETDKQPNCTWDTAKAVIEAVPK